MKKRDRRAFLQTSAGALAVGLSPQAIAALKVGLAPERFAGGADTAQTAPALASNNGRKPLRLGLIIGVGEDPDSHSLKISGPGWPNDCEKLSTNTRLRRPRLSSADLERKYGISTRVRSR